MDASDAIFCLAMSILGVGVLVALYAAVGLRPPVARPRPAEPAGDSIPRIPIALDPHEGPTMHPYSRDEVTARAKKLFPHLDPAQIAAFVTKLMGILSVLLPLFMSSHAEAPKVRPMMLAMLEAAEEIEPDPSSPALMKGPLLDPFVREGLTKGLDALLKLGQDRGGDAIDVVMSLWDKIPYVGAI
jgi:hypothetical protein